MVDEYTLVRLYSGGSMVFAELVAVCNGCPVPPRLLADRRVQAILEVAATLTDWETDVIAFGKETARTGMASTSSTRPDACSHTTTEQDQLTMIFGLDRWHHELRS
jgi:hypothetical protein